MRQREQPDVRLVCGGSGVERGRVERLPRAVLLVFEKGRLVDEHVSVPHRLDHLRRGSRVAGDRDLAAAPGGPEHLLGRHNPVVRERHRVTVLQRAPFGAGGNAERVRRGDVEPARALVLDQRVADGEAAVQHREDLEHVAVPREPIARVQLDQRVLVGELAEDATQIAEQRYETRRAIDRDRLLAAAEGERLQHPGEAEIVVGVVVGQEHLAQVDESHRRREQLPLRPFAAVEQESFAPAPDEQRRSAAEGGRHRARRAEEHEVEVHARSMDGGARGGAARAAVIYPAGRTRRSPGRIVAPASPFRCSIFQTPSRGSPA